eukprot:5521137-Prymnesium_polylepis.1
MGHRPSCVPVVLVAPHVRECSNQHPQAHLLRADTSAHRAAAPPHAGEHGCTISPSGAALSPKRRVGRTGPCGCA